MNQTDWRTPRRIEADYFASVRDLLREYFVRRERGLYQADQYLREYAWTVARRMITGVLRDGGGSWREAARRSTQGERVFRALGAEMRGPVGERARALVKLNARYISSLPHDIAEQFTASMLKAELEGARAETFRHTLMKRLTRSRAALLARTETSKASTALTRARSEDLRLDWWIWRTSQDQRVRFSHRKLQGVVCSWNDLPAPELLVGEKSEGHYAAGDIYNCRCYPEPILSMDQLRFPVRLYNAGRVRYVTRAEFSNIARIPNQENLNARFAVNRS